jgi:hypothetical protein
MDAIFERPWVRRVLFAGAAGWVALFLASTSDIVAGGPEPSAVVRQVSSIRATVEQWVWEARSCFGCYGRGGDGIFASRDTGVPAGQSQRAVASLNR